MHSNATENYLGRKIYFYIYKCVKNPLYVRFTLPNFQLSKFFLIFRGMKITYEFLKITVGTEIESM